MGLGFIMFIFGYPKQITRFSLLEILFKDVCIALFFFASHTLPHDGRGGRGGREARRRISGGGFGKDDDDDDDDRR